MKRIIIYSNFQKKSELQSFEGKSEFIGVPLNKNLKIS